MERGEINYKGESEYWGKNMSRDKVGEQIMSKE